MPAAPRPPCINGDGRPAVCLTGKHAGLCDPCRARVRRREASPEQREAAQEASRRHRATPRYRETKQRYRSSPEGRETTRWWPTSGRCTTRRQPPDTDATPSHSGVARATACPLAWETGDNAHRPGRLT